MSAKESTPNPDQSQDLQIFTQNGWKIRTIVKDGEPWFVAADVCKALEHTNPTVAIRPLDEDERAKLDLGSNKVANIINESGLYALIMRSDLEEAKKFRKWVTNEVLPQIRKTGTYVHNIPQNYSEALQLAADQAKQLELQAPKVQFAETVEGSEDCVSIGEFAKIHGGIGRNKLFAMLRDHKVLMSNNTPYQKHITQGHFEVTEKTTSAGLKHVTLVTGKGQLYLQKKLSKWI